MSEAPKLLSERLADQAGQVVEMAEDLRRRGHMAASLEFAIEAAKILQAARAVEEMERAARP